MIPQTFGESAQRVRHRFVRRATLVRSLPAPTGRGSRTFARTSWVWCSTLRFRPQPSALSRRPSAVGAPRAARRARHAARRTQPSALSPRPSALGTQPSALSTQHSALGPRPSALSPRPSALGPRHSALGTRPSARRAPRAALGLGFGFGPQPRPSHSRTVRRTESCRHPFVSSERPRTPQPRSLGPVRTHSSGADDSAHIRFTCRLAAERGPEGCAEHPDRGSWRPPAAHVSFEPLTRTSPPLRTLEGVGGPMLVLPPSSPVLDSSVGSQCSPLRRTDFGDRTRRKRREIDRGRTLPARPNFGGEYPAPLLTAHTTSRSPRFLLTLSEPVKNSRATRRGSGASSI